MSLSSQTQQTLPWAGTTHLAATPAALDMLFEGKIACLCVPDFIPVEECMRLKKRAEECEFNDYFNVVPPIKKVGITVFEFDEIGKEQYFGAVEDANRRIQLFTDGGLCPLERTLAWLSKLSPDRKVSIAYELGFGPYFAGLVRRIENGTMVHVDFAPLEQPGWAVAQVRSQLVFNIFLEVPRVDPGVVKVWQKQCQPSDGQFKVTGAYGYSPDVVAGVPCATIAPQMGMIMLINTRNYHQVSEASGVRLTFSASVGLMPDNNIVLWS